jgi:hypothetical protein
MNFQHLFSITVVFQRHQTSQYILENRTSIIAKKNEEQKEITEKDSQ